MKGFLPNPVELVKLSVKLKITIVAGDGNIEKVS
jgi:hypothetical protein